jgi:hypothetical protein
LFHTIQLVSLRGKLSQNALSWLQVNGKLLCLLCTISFKRIQHRQKRANKRKHATTDSSAKEKNGAKDAKVSKKATSSDERNTPVGDNPLKQFYTSQPRYAKHSLTFSRAPTDFFHIKIISPSIENPQTQLVERWLLWPLKYHIFSVIYCLISSTLHCTVM